MKSYKFKCPNCGSKEFDCTMPVLTRFKTCTRIRQSVFGEYLMQHADYCEADSGALGDTPEGRVINIECYECSARWSTFEDAVVAGVFLLEMRQA